MTVGAWVYEEMIKRGWTQQRLAEESGLPLNRVTDIIIGGRPAVSDLAAICNALEGKQA